MKTLTSIGTFVRRQPHWRLYTIAAILIIGGSIWLLSGDKTVANAPTFVARRGPLEITVLEGGSLQALESQEIKCEVRVGYQGTKILRIVEEGYLVTEDDVRTNKVLCELDSSELQKQIVQQEIQFQSAMASLTDAQQNYEIQLGQNESDVKTAEQKAKFARMDFDKYLGDTITGTIIAEVGLDKFLEMVVAVGEVENGNGANGLHGPNGGGDKDVSTSATPVAGAAQPAVLTAPRVSDAAALQAIQLVGGSDLRRPNGNGAGAQAAPPSEMPMEEEAKAPEMPKIRIDFSRYADIDVLGDGEAKQKLRKFDDDLQVAQKELGQATTALEGTRRLFAKGFVPKTEITRDEISHESARLKVQSAATARALFLKYEFPRTAEETLSKYAESVRELDKARRVAISKLAQARARLNSARGQYEVQARQRRDLQEQLEKCSLVAKKTGLVVYGGSGEQFYGNQEPIREGATVRERQSIVTIPDLSRMSVNVKIHESYIKKVKKGQKARITVDAFPDERLMGEVTKVAVLPDSQNRWMNPDLKVYLTTITIDGTHDWVKPGMSAKVEILVNHLSDVVYIPVQAVSPGNGKQFCYVMNGFKPERREVEVGDFTDEFIEIKKGLKEGERVLLRPPGSSEIEGAPRDNKPAEPEREPSPAEPVAAAPAKSA